jgi:hypothetical protein
MVMQTDQEKYTFSNIGRTWRKVGDRKAVDRFMRKIGKTNTQCAYLRVLSMYFQWLKEKGVGLSLDQFITNNHVD